MSMSESETAKTSEIRERFPSLKRVHNGKQVAYFDGPGGTQVPKDVVDAMSDYLINHNANTHWEYPTSIETDRLIQDSREALADFLNAESDEVVFGQNMTSLTFHLARALGRGMTEGDEIIVTELDHHANIDTWRSLEKDRGVKILTLPADAEAGVLRLEMLEDMFSPRTRLLAIGAASNAIGTISDAQRACDMAHSRDVLSFVDAVHFAAHELVDVKKIGCDFLACSAYKFYGPHIGILYGRKELLEKTDFPKLAPSPNNAPDRAETGTQSHESIVGAAAAVDFLASLSSGENRRNSLELTFRNLKERKRSLVRKFFEEFSDSERIKIFGVGPDEPRTPTVALAIEGISSTMAARRLAEAGLFVSNGDFYASTIVDRLGYANEGLVRIGFACYTDDAEVTRLIETIKSL
jgi:cysteine desulfurase family protein (TIGR01976 family)